MKAGLKISASTLNSLITELDVQLVSFSECLLSPGYRLNVKRHESPCIYYVIAGSGVLHFPGAPPIAVKPHALIIVPPNYSFSLETGEQNSMGDIVTVNGFDNIDQANLVGTFSAGNKAPKTIVFCVFVRTLFCKSMGLFETLSEPVVEEFNADDRLDIKLRSVMAELMSQEVAAGAMTAALLKEIIITLFRRSISSLTSWAGRVSVLSDPQVALAFANMVTQPGKAHTIHTLATGACLGRSTFIARFSNTVGQSPMTVLRELRMRQAALQLQMSNLPVEQILRNAGYCSRGSFVKAFRASYGVDPSTYRDSKPAVATIYAEKVKLTTCVPHL